LSEHQSERSDPFRTRFSWEGEGERKKKERVIMWKSDLAGGKEVYRDGKGGSTRKKAQKKRKTYWGWGVLIL